MLIAFIERLIRRLGVTVETLDKQEVSRQLVCKHCGGPIIEYNAPYQSYELCEGEMMWVVRYKKLRWCKDYGMDEALEHYGPIYDHTFRKRCIRCGLYKKRHQFDKVKEKTGKTRARPTCKACVKELSKREHHYKHYRSKHGIESSKTKTKRVAKADRKKEESGD